MDTLLTSLKNHGKVKGEAYPPVKIIENEEEPHPHPTIEQLIKTRGTPPPAMQNHWKAKGETIPRLWES